MIYLIPELKYLNKEDLKKNMDDESIYYYSYLFEEDNDTDNEKDKKKNKHIEDYQKEYNFSDNFQYLNYILAVVAITKMFV